MRKVELLAPAGSMEALEAAVQCGADAVYLGGQAFGARAFAANFDREQLKEAIAYAHLYGVKVYVTVNTLVYEEEMEACLAYVEELQKSDVDALIIQDLGVLRLIHLHFPDMELHASTQMHVHQEDGIALLKEYGVKREVVARETSLADLRRFCETDVEIEAFVHGALCVSYSGQCLLSADLFKRSGNRGMCAQPCRMRYTLLEEGQKVASAGSYLLSPKDLCTLDHIGDLIDAGVASFKIEGRMKKSEYVAQVVSNYRRAIDAHLQKKAYHSRQDLPALQRLFHRGFTLGHLYEQRGPQLINQYRPNHMGVALGKVVSVRRDRISVSLCADLHQGDGVRILKAKEDDGFIVNRMYDTSGRLISHAKAGEQVALDKRGYVEVGAKLIKSSDVLLEQALQAQVKARPRKVLIKMRAELKVGHVVRLWVNDGEREVYAESEIGCEAAKSAGMGKEAIAKQLSKCGDTPFQITSMQIEVQDHLFIANKALNEVRRNALDALAHKRMRRYKERTVWKEVEAIASSPQSVYPLKVYYHVHQSRQAAALKDAEGEIVAYGTLWETLRKEGIHAIKGASRVKTHPYQEETLIQEIGGLRSKKAKVSGASLNVVNASAVRFLQEYGIEDICLSDECEKEQAAAIIKAYRQRFGTTFQAGIKIYGRMEDMISKHCVIADVLANGAIHCGKCHAHHYALQDEKGRRFPLYGDEDCLMHVLSPQVRDWIDALPAFYEAGVRSFHVHFYEEEETVIKQIVKRIEAKREQLS